MAKRKSLPKAITLSKTVTPEDVAGAEPATGVLEKLDFRKEDIDFDILESGVSAVAQEKWNPANNRDRRLERRFNSNRGLRRHVAIRAYTRYLDEGGEAGDIQSFMEWLIANWESILKMIVSIINLFA